jgi:hypothetical protein
MYRLTCVIMAALCLFAGALHAQSVIDPNHPPVVITQPCCGQKPAYTDPAYASFTGQVAVATYERDPSSPFVLSVIGLHNITGTIPPRNTNYAAPTYNNAQWTNAKIGGVFGVTLDSAGNIYVAATTLYFTKSVGIGNSHGSIYKIANGTGAVTLLVNLPASAVGTPNAAGLGNIAYDCNTRTLFATSLDTGRIYQINPTTGAIVATFDHGLSLSTPVADDPSKTYTQPVRRVFAVRPDGNRLRYSVWRENDGAPDPTAANEIWSIGLNSVTGFNGTPQLDISMPPLTATNLSNPVAGINIGPNGTYLFAERSISGSSSITTSAHRSRTLEYGPPPAWTPAPQSKFQVSMFPNPGSDAGGADYDWTPGAPLGVWAMSDAMQIGAVNIYGLQGIPMTGGSIANSVLIDVSGGVAQQNKTMLGSVDVPCPNCNAPDLAIKGSDLTCQSPAQYCASGATGSTFTWAVTGGTFTPAGPGCINVNWNATGPYSISLTATQPNGCKTTVTRSFGPCNVCCDATVKANVVSIVPTTPGHYNVTTALTSPIGPIRRISATVVSTYQTVPALCGTPSGPVGSIIAAAPPQNGFASFLPPFWREVKWTSGTPQVVNNTNFTFEIVVPPALTNGCSDQIRFCVRWELTNADCRTCEVTTCYVINRGHPLPDNPTDDVH